MDARRHQIIACAFGRGRGQDRRLELEKTLLLHAAPDRINDCAALHDVLVQVLATQVEEPVLEPCFLGIFLLAEHRHRQFAGRPQNLDLADIDLDRAGRQVGILGAARPPPHLAVDPHHPFRAQRLGHLESRAVGIGHHLGEPVMVAQIDEQHAAMVANAVAPARQPGLDADVALAERAAGMGAVAVHAHSNG